MSMVEISAAISDAASTAAAAHGIAGKILLSSRRSRSQSPTLSLPSAAAPPVAVRPNSFRVAVVPRAFACRTPRRTRRRSRTEGGDEDGGDDGFPGDGSSGDDDGPFGGGSGRGGGGGRNYGDSGSQWSEGSEQPYGDGSSDPAFDFVYEVLCWMAFSNCAHFALKKIWLMLAEKGKSLPFRLFPLTC